MLSFHLLLATIVAIALIGNGAANHIRTGKVTMDGEVETAEGPRHYSTDAFLTKPIVCWEDLVKDGFSVDKCTAETIRFVGDIDEDDFKKGIVITFPVEEYKAFGCPLPPHDPKEKAPEVIFRMIKSVKLGDDKATVHTTFIDPGMVVPTIMVHIGELANSARQTLGDSASASGAGSLLTSSRVNNIGVRFWQRSGSVTPFAGASISYSLQASGGICNFRFDLRRRQVTWEQRIDATASATLTAAGGISRTASGTIFKVPIPGAGFSMSIFLLGRISAGFTAALDWETEFNLDASATIRFTGGVHEGQRIVLGIGSLGKSTLPSSPSSTRSGSVVFNTAVAAAARANGFVGVRPVLALELTLPIIPDANVGIGASVGLNAAIAAMTPPFAAVTSGRPLSSTCSSCHFVQGTLDVEGRRLSITAEAPILGDREFVIREDLFTVRLGTLCLFSATC